MSQSTARSAAAARRDEPREFAAAPGDLPERGAVPVKRPVGTPEPGTGGAGAWLIAWGELAVLGFLAIVGAFFASADASPGDYACGTILVLAALALAFLRLKARFDGSPDGWAASGCSSRPATNMAAFTMPGSRCLSSAAPPSS
jgi:hypothetical protein